MFISCWSSVPISLIALLVDRRSEVGAWCTLFQDVCSVFGSCLLFVLLQKELSAEKLPVGTSRPASLHISLESLNKLNHDGGAPDPNLRADGDAGGSSCNGSEPLPSSCFGSRPGLDHSLSDSLYDSFSSCTSQASNGV